MLETSYSVLRYIVVGYIFTQVKIELKLNLCSWLEFCSKEEIFVQGRQFSSIISFLLFLSL